MDSKFDSKVVNELNRMAQARWKEIMDETESARLSLTEEQFKIMRVYWQLSYESAVADTMTQMKEIYHNDVDLFQTIFEEEEVN